MLHQEQRRLEISCEPHKDPFAEEDRSLENQVPGHHRSGRWSSAGHGQEGAHESASSRCGFASHCYHGGSLRRFLCPSWVSMFIFLYFFFFFFPFCLNFLLLLTQFSVCVLVKFAVLSCDFIYSVMELCIGFQHSEIPFRINWKP